MAGRQRALHAQGGKGQAPITLDDSSDDEPPPPPPAARGRQGPCAKGAREPDGGCPCSATTRRVRGHKRCLAALGFIRDAADNYEYVDPRVLSLSGRDLKTLLPGRMLNATAIDSYSARLRQDNPDCVVMYSGQDVTGITVSPYMRGAIARAEREGPPRMVIIPVHFVLHWVLSVWDAEHGLRVFNSLGDDTASVNRVLAGAPLVRLAKGLRIMDKHGDWVGGKSKPPNYPQQGNGTDCGVFVCMNATRLLDGRPFFTQRNADRSRARIALRILTAKHRHTAIEPSPRTRASARLAR